MKRTCRGCGGGPSGAGDISGPNRCPRRYRAGKMARVRPCVTSAVRTTVRNCTRDEVGQGDPLVRPRLPRRCQGPWPGGLHDPHPCLREPGCQDGGLRQAIGRQPFRERVRFEERAIDFLRPGCQNAVQTNGVGMAVPPYVEITEWTLPPINRPVSVEPA
jgi:hypothetical protein